MITRTKYPGICNNCGRKSEYYIRAGIHTLQLCGTCLNSLASAAKALLVKDIEAVPYDNSKETGLIKDVKRCSPQMVAEADCDGDPNCHKCWSKA